MKDLNKWLEEAYNEYNTPEVKQMLAGMPAHMTMQNAVPLICLDGFSVSIQASCNHYCAPRHNFNAIEQASKTYFYPPSDYRTVEGKTFISVDYSIYSEFELGFPNEAEDLLMPYVEDESDPTGTVYGYVPRQVIEAVIEKHGGIVGVMTRYQLENNGPKF